MAVQTLGHLRRLAGLWAVFGVIFALSTPVQAAESIRVLMASDVHRLDVRADSEVWLTDGQSRSYSYNTALHIELRGAALLVNGTRVVGEQLTLRAGEHDLKLLVTACPRWEPWRGATARR